MYQYKRTLSILFLLSAVLILAAACTPAQSTQASESASTQSEEHSAESPHDDEHEHGAMSMTHMHIEAPAEFASLTNPFAEDDDAIKAGAEIFQTNCASCHGSEGQGDGPAAEALDPKPATLADGMMMGDLSDGYLFWRVSKGGQMEPFNSAMPAWETGLTTQERWQVISFVRTLADDTDDHMHSREGHMEDDQMHGVEGHMEDDHVEDEHAGAETVGDHTESEHMNDGH